MTIGILKSPSPRNRNTISVMNSKFLSVSSMNTLFAFLKVNDSRRYLILTGGLNHRFPWPFPTPPPPQPVLDISKQIEQRARLGEIFAR